MTTTLTTGRAAPLLLAAGLAGWAAATAAHLERRSLARRLAGARHAAGIDLLTGIPNRAGLANAAATMAGAVLVAYLDVDGFKPVNDTHGHHTGDALLVAFAGRLAALAALHHGTAARLGGDEFALIVPCPAGCSGEVAAASLTAGLDRMVADPFAVAGQRIHVRASVGTATGEATDLVRLLTTADQLMYRTKHTRRVP